MGDFEKEPTLNDANPTSTSRVSIIAILMTVLAFLAPVAIAGYDWGFDYYININAILWGIYMDGYSIRFEFLNPFTLMMMIPFSLFRIASVYLFTRYYQGKTTKGRAWIAAVSGDAPFLFVYGIWFITAGISGGLGFNYPAPIMMIVGFLLLWKFPAYEATVPWEGADSSTPWWEESSEEKTEPTADNQPW